MKTAIGEFLNTSTQTVAASGLITFDNTNSTYPDNYYSYNSTTNKISILQPGVYEIVSNFNVIATAAGDVSITMYEGSNPAAGAIASDSFDAIGDYGNLSVINVVKVKSGIWGSYATIEFISNAATSIDNAVCIINKVA